MNGTGTVPHLTTSWLTYPLPKLSREISDRKQTGGSTSLTTSTAAAVKTSLMAVRLSLVRAARGHGG